jgi:hypothetical protein
VLSELVLRKKSCSCIDAWRWDLEMFFAVVANGRCDYGGNIKAKRLHNGKRGEGEGVKEVFLAQNFEK